MDQMLPGVNALVVTNELELATLAAKLGGRPVSAIPVGNVLRSRAELEAVWLIADGKPVPELAPPAGPKGRLPLSLFHYGLPARGKGFKRLLDALKLTREAGVPATLYLGGDFTPGERLTEELLGMITDSGLADAVIRLGYIPQGQLEAETAKYWLGVFPFDEGFSSKRSSVAAISHCDLPLAVGGGSAEDHAYYAPEQNTSASLSVLLVELFSGRLAEEWKDQIHRQREYSVRFSFKRIAQTHLDLYREAMKADI